MQGMADQHHPYPVALGSTPKFLITKPVAAAWH